MLNKFKRKVNQKEQNASKGKAISSPRKTAAKVPAPIKRGREWAHTDPAVVSDAFKYSLRKDLSKGPVICVFSGGSSGKSEAHIQSARALAAVFHKYNITLVNGGDGGGSGLMGAICQEQLRLSGPSSLIGIRPIARGKSSLSASPVQQHTITNERGGTTILVDNLHTRKLLMHRHVMAGGAGSGFVALSGGFGTLDELMECASWALRGFHDKPVVMFSVDGFFDYLVKWMQVGVEEEFVKESARQVVMCVDTAEDVVRCLREYKATKKPGVNWKV